MRTEAATRTVSGSVMDTGAIQDPGTSDWTVTRTATGTYVIRFLRPFRNLPAVTTTTTGWVLTGISPSARDSITVNTYNPASGSGVNSIFFFQAVGR